MDGGRCAGASTCEVCIHSQTCVQKACLFVVQRMSLMNMGEWIRNARRIPMLLACLDDTCLNVIAPMKWKAEARGDLAMEHAWDNSTGGDADVSALRQRCRSIQQQGLEEGVQGMACNCCCFATSF